MIHDKLRQFAQEQNVAYGIIEGWWEERAAVREYDGGMAREQAEEAALEDVLGMFRAQATPYRGGLMVTMEKWDG